MRVRWLGFGVALLLAAATVKNSSASAVFSTEEIRTAFKHSQPVLKLPLPDGSIRTYLFASTELLSSNPEVPIRTFTGSSVEDPNCLANVVLTPNSISAQIFSREGTHYLNSTLGKAGEILLTFDAGLARTQVDYQCLTDPGEPDLRAQGALEAQSSSFQNVLRRFRLAPAATAEFTQFFGSKEAALLEVVTAMSRADGIFQRELGISFQLVSGFEQMVFNDPPSDPYSINEPTEKLLNEAQSAFDGFIGTANYDVGILLTRGTYGLAYFSSVCDPARKGSSCIGLPEPAGDAFHVNLVTHELAHQFGARHTFNSPMGLCAERRDGFTAYEPGAGSTIMSYSSLPCSDDSFQPRHDAYFHSESLKQILEFVNSAAASCAQTSPRDNTAPAVSTGPEHIIPAETPFALTATASDAENDAILYCWEQRDLGPARALSAPDDATGPLFRSFPPSNSSTRIFPRLETILSGEDSREERLPTTGRTMRFRVTARDSHEDGAVAWSDTQIRVINTGAPFRITSHSSEQTLTGATTIQWEVAGTTAAPINASQVRITLSTNGGQSFPIILADSTANDGSEEVVLPEISSGDVRIKVAPTNNIFFDINGAALTIAGPPTGAVRLEATRAANGAVLVSWDSEVGVTYRLERSSALPSVRWAEVLRTNATSTSVSVDFPAIGPGAYYRVVRP